VLPSNQISIRDGGEQMKSVSTNKFSIRPDQFKQNNSLPFEDRGDDQTLRENDRQYRKYLIDTGLLLPVNQRNIDGPLYPDVDIHPLTRQKVLRLGSITVDQKVFSRKRYW
jgi:hypothetical protein